MKALDECILVILSVLFITEESSFSCKRNLKVRPVKWKLLMKLHSSGTILSVLLLKIVHFLANETQISVWPFKRKLSTTSDGTVCFITIESSFSCKRNPKVWPLNWKLLMSAFRMLLLVLVPLQIHIVHFLGGVCLFWTKEPSRESVKPFSGLLDMKPRIFSSYLMYCMIKLA